MKLCLNAWKAVQEYRIYVDKLKSAKVINDSERKEKLSLENFAIWLAEEFPRFMEAKKR